MIESLLVYDGEFVGPNMTGVAYGWTDRGVPCYIGITNGDVFGRIKTHLNKKSEAYLFQNKLRARPNDFKCYTLHWSNQYSKLKEMEKFFIQKFNTYKDDNPEFGYNQTRGGDGTIGLKPFMGRRHTDDSKRKIALSKIGIRRKPFTDLWKNRIAISSQGRVGITHTEDTKKLLSEKTRLYFVNNPEARQRISEYRKSQVGKKRGPYKKKSPTTGSVSQV